MADIQFREEGASYAQSRSEKPSFLTRLVMATGLVRTERQAQYVLLAIAVGATLLAFIVPLFLSDSEPASQTEVRTGPGPRR
jgi:hypothetical protein